MEIPAFTLMTANMLLEYISSCYTRSFAAVDVAALLTERALNISILALDLVSSDLTHLAMAEETTGLKGRIREIKNVWVICQTQHPENGHYAGLIIMVKFHSADDSLKGGIWTGKFLPAIWIIADAFGAMLWEHGVCIL